MPDSPLDKKETIAALGRVVDPQLGESIVVLNMVREIDGEKITLAIPSPGAAYQGELIERIRDELGANAEVEFVPMSDDERAMLGARLDGAGTPKAGMRGPASRPATGSSPFEQSISPLMDLSGKTRIIAISSGKGGVGKSSVTTNLAVTLARDYDVAVIDADVYGFSIPKMLGIESEPEIDGDRIIPPEADGVKVVSMGFFIEEDQAVVWRGPMLHKALEQFITDVRWGEPDFLLIDMPPGTGDIALSIAQFMPRSEVVVVTTPQPAAQRVAQRSAAMARKVNLPVVGVIENMSWFTGDDAKRYELFGSGGGELLADSLGVDLLGQVPLVPALRSGGDDGVPIAVSDPGGEAAMAIAEIASRLEAMPPPVINPDDIVVPRSAGGGEHSQSSPQAPTAVESPTVRPGGLNVTPKRPT